MTIRYSRKSDFLFWMISRKYFRLSWMRSNCARPGKRCQPSLGALCLVQTRLMSHQAMQHCLVHVQDTTVVPISMWRCKALHERRAD